MSRTFLPFLPMFHPGLRDGTKVATTRSKRYGEAGDIVDSPVGPLRLLSVEKMALRTVRDNWWREEGVVSPGHFEKVWADIHPGTGFRPDDVKWLHLFELALGNLDDSDGQGFALRNHGGAGEAVDLEVGEVVVQPQDGLLGVAGPSPSEVLAPRLGSKEDGAVRRRLGDDEGVHARPSRKRAKSESAGGGRK